MRSCRSGRIAPASRGLSTWKSVPRSIRRTAARPQFLAMSVALEDQGETVPRRGTTRKASPRACPGGLP